MSFGVLIIKHIKMKHLIRLSIVMTLLIQSMAFSQTNSLEIISNKYNSLLKEQNKGVAILIKKGNNIEKASLGHFNLTEHSVFNIGSATKTFTAILILQEMEKGNLQLTDSIGTYLTPIKNVDASLTIEALLTHQSGVDEVIGKNILDMFYAKNDSLYNDNLLDQVEKSNPEKVGTFNYTNTNYFLLGKIIEKVTDQSYFDLLRERIFMPLKMNNTYPYVHKNLPNLAIPFHNGEDVSRYLDHRFFSNIAFSAGSIASTLSDMELFYTSLFETEKLLKKESLQLMLSSGNAYYGLGIFKSEYNGILYYGHGGNNIGYAFNNGYNPTTKELFLMFTNSIAIPIKSIESDVIGYLNNETISNFKSLDIDTFKTYIGTYLINEANLKLTVALEDSKMYLVSEEQGLKSELTQKSDISLYDTKYGVTLTLIEDNNTSLTFNQNGFTTTIHKITLEDKN